jgi:benzoyl-CoA reductase/2-hydroxyglutaryl-CoA dehydratase subunit BcrC/BadD/HgdB
MTPNLLQDAYAQRLSAVRSQPPDTPVIGVVGHGVPCELVLASGCACALVSADACTDTPLADEFMERDFPAEIRSLFNQALRGDFAFLELLVIPSTTDGYLQLYYYLKEVQRLGRGEQLPPLYLYDVPQTRCATSYRYGLARTYELKRRLEVMTGSEITNQALLNAVESVNVRRQAVRQLLELRNAGRLKGSEAMELIGAGFWMEPRTYAAAVGRVVGDTANLRSTEAAAKVLVVPSVPLYDTCLHRALEVGGVCVVAEDDAYGSRSVGDIDVDIAGSESLVHAVFDHYYADDSGPRVFPPELRETWLATHVSDVDAVVFYIPPGDLWLGWDYPRLRYLVAHTGKPSILLRDDAHLREGQQAITNAIAEFKSEMYV